MKAKQSKREKEIKKTVKEFSDIYNSYPELDKNIKQILLIRLEVRLSEYWDKGRLELDAEIRSKNES